MFLPHNIKVKLEPLMEAMSQTGAASSDALKKYLTLRTKLSVSQIEIDQYLLEHMESIELADCSVDIILTLVRILNRNDKMPKSTILLDKLTKACDNPSSYHLHAGYLCLKKQYQDNENLAKIHHFSWGAAQQGNLIAQINLSWIHPEGLKISEYEIKQKNEMTVKWLRLAAEQGHADAQANLGWMYLKGRGIQAEEIIYKDEIAVKWLRLAAKQGHADAQYNLGWIYKQGRGIAKGEIIQKDEIAAKWFRLAAEQGHADAQYNLGWMYLEGRGVRAKELAEKDEIAAKWLRLAAEQGHADAQAMLGRMYLDGLGVRPDEITKKDEIAAKWLRLAAEQGHADAQYNLGWMYLKRRGIRADEIKQKDEIAAKWLRLAAEQGHADAQNNLGWMYLEGRGVRASEFTQKDEIAVKWFRLAAEQGHANAQNNLGWMYLEGRGVPVAEKPYANLLADYWRIKSQMQSNPVKPKEVIVKCPRLTNRENKILTLMLDRNMSYKLASDWIDPPRNNSEQGIVSSLIGMLQYFNPSPKESHQGARYFIYLLYLLSKNNNLIQYNNKTPELNLFQLPINILREIAFHLFKEIAPTHHNIIDNIGFYTLVQSPTKALFKGTSDLETSRKKAIETTSTISGLSTQLSMWIKEDTHKTNKTPKEKQLLTKMETQLQRLEEINSAPTPPMLK